MTGNTMEGLGVLGGKNLYRRAAVEFLLQAATPCKLFSLSAQLAEAVTPPVRVHSTMLEY